MAATSLEIANDALTEIGAANITSLTANLTKEDRVCNRFYAKLRDTLLMQFTWNFAKKATPLNRTDLYDTSDDYDDYATITGITLSNPVKITATNSYTAGQIVYLADIVGTTELNGLYFEISAPTSALFYLLGVDGAKYTAYTSGGQAILAEPITDYRSGYTYSLPSDCLKPIALDSGANFEILESRLVTTDSAPILIYTKQVTDTTKFTVTFEECLKFSLAMSLCRPILGAKEGSLARERIKGDYNQAMAAAARIESNSVKKEYAYSDTWTAN